MLVDLRDAEQIMHQNRALMKVLIRNYSCWTITMESKRRYGRCLYVAKEVAGSCMKRERLRIYLGSIN